MPIVDIHVREEGIPAFEELFLYACPKFISANPPPYDDSDVLSAYIDTPPVEPAQRHLSLFLSEVRAQAPVPTLRSFLKLYTSLDANKLAGFLDADEEEMVQQLMVMKQASRSVSRVDNEKGLLDGQTISTSDLDFVISGVGVVLQMDGSAMLTASVPQQNMVHIAESTVGRRYAGWFIRNTEHAQRVLDTLKGLPLPVPSSAGAHPAEAGKDTAANAAASAPATGGKKVAWGSAKAA